MRTKTIIKGFKNSQKFRFILTANSGEEVGMYMTIQQLSDMCANRDTRLAVLDALDQLARDRSEAKSRDAQLPTGLVRNAFVFRQVQVDLR
jgi:hypothetical protein